MKRSFSLFLVVVAPFVCLGQAQATTINYQEGVSPSGSYAAPAADIRRDNPDFTTGGAQVRVGRTGNPNSDPPDYDKYWRSIFEFELTGINASDTINSVSFNLTHDGTGQGTSASSFEFQLRQYDFGYDETNTTWNDPGGDLSDATAGGTLGTVLSTADVFIQSTAGTVSTFGDSALFRTAVANALASGEPLRFLVLSQGAEASDGSLGKELAKFYSDDELTVVSGRPELVIDFTRVPEPTSIALCAVVGIVGCGLRRRGASA